MSDDLDLFRQETAAWLEANCPASMRQPITEDSVLWSGKHMQFISEDQKVWFERMRDKGWFAPNWPAEYGGGGLDPKRARIVEQEMSRLKCRAPQYNLGVWMIGPAMLDFATHEQKLEHLKPMMRGEIRWCQGFSEPNAGSDLASLKTQAVPDGDDYIVNGSKIWTSYGDQADWMYALVRTDNSKKQEGISLLLIDMTLPGVVVKPIELISGKSSFCEVFFDNVRVPKRQLIGGENKGWTVAKALLQHERAAMSKFAEGAKPSHDALAVLKPVLEANRSRAETAVLRDQLAKSLMDFHAFGMTAMKMKEEMLARQDVSAVASIMKLVQSELEVQKYEVIMKGLGADALGWQDENASTPEAQEREEITKQWMLAKSVTIAGGASEIQLNIIAKRVLGLPDYGGVKA